LWLAVSSDGSSEKHQALRCAASRAVLDPRKQAPL